MHKEGVAIVNLLDDMSESVWVGPSEWRTYILNPEHCDQDADVYYRDLLPLENEPVVPVTYNRPVICEAMFFQHKFCAGRIALTAVSLNIISLTVGLTWSIVKRDPGTGFTMAAFGALPISVLSLVISLWREPLRDNM